VDDRYKPLHSTFSVEIGSHGFFFALGWPGTVILRISASQSPATLEFSETGKKKFKFFPQFLI
jgi:hypothetical protein